jgi:hypothetical protein
MALHRIYFAKGAQALVTIPHRRGAPVRVSAGTFEIVDTRYSVDSDEHVIVAAGTAASIDATSTTLTAKAGRNAADRRALTVTATADLVIGAQYIMEAASGQAELVRIAATPSGTLARAAQEIRGDFATGATLRGVQVSATFPADPAADEDNLDDGAFVVIWTFPGLPPLRESIHLERGEEAQLATLDDLRELDPMLSIAGGDRIDPATALARAHKDFRADLQMAGVAESDMLAGPLGRDAVCYRAAFLATQHGDDPVSERKATAYQARYLELRGALVVGAKKPEVVALDKDQQARTVNPAALFHGWGFGKGKD